LFVQDKKISGSGAERTFQSPPLKSGKNYSYNVRIVWTVGGKQQQAQHKVPIKAGERVIVNFVATAAQPAPMNDPPVAKPAAPSTAPPAGQDGDLTADEQAVLDLTNKERAKAGGKPLTANGKLTAAARGHSANMARQKTLNHTLDGKQFFERIAATGYQSGYAGENIAYGARTAEEVMNMWMNSPGHKTNILSENYQQIGIGIRAAADGTKYYTQVFATPLPPAVPPSPK
ncbi:MAG: CAP domain-containing protein, partial [Pirellulales bacterium]